MIQILIVEDDLQLNQLYSRALQNEGYQTISATNGIQAFDILELHHIDLIISDLMMPEMDGISLIDHLRLSNYAMPVLIISAKSALHDKKQGFQVGADDYMVKPIDVNEMIWRIEALLRRSNLTNTKTITYKNTTLDSDSLTVHSPQGNLQLVNKEFMLLFKLLSSPNKVYTRMQLMNEIWGPGSESDTHTLDVHISRLREKFKDNEDFKIITIRGLGYKIGEKNNET